MHMSTIFCEEDSQAVNILDSIVDEVVKSLPVYYDIDSYISRSESGYSKHNWVSKEKQLYREREYYKRHDTVKLKSERFYLSQQQCRPFNECEEMDSEHQLIVKVNEMVDTPRALLEDIK